MEETTSSPISSVNNRKEYMREYQRKRYLADTNSYYIYSYCCN